MSSSSFPAGGGSASLLERKVQNMLHRDVDGVKVQRQHQQSFSHTRNSTLNVVPNPNGNTSASPTPSQTATALSTPSLRPSHLSLPEPAAGDESPLSITRRQSSLQLNRRDLAAISDDEEAGVAQYTGNGRGGWRRPAGSAAGAPLPAGEAVERTQSLSVLSPLPEVSMERGISERQYSNSISKRAQPVSTASANSPQVSTGKIPLSPTSSSSTAPVAHPRFKTRAPIRSWKERPSSVQAKDELLRTARRYGSGLAGEGAEAVKARKRAMMEEKEQERTRGMEASGSGSGRAAGQGGGEKEEEERKEPRIPGGDFSGMGSRNRRYDEEEDGAPNNRVLSWLRHDNNMKGSNLHTADSISVSEDDGDDRQGRKVKSTVDRLQASLSKGRRKVIGIPSKLREMMSLHPKGAGKNEKEDGKEERKGEEEDSEDSQKDRQSTAVNGIESRNGSGDERRDLIATTESAMLNSRNIAPASSALSSSSSTPPADPSAMYVATSTSADNPSNANTNNRYDTSTPYDDDTPIPPLRVDVSALDRSTFASAPPNPPLPTHPNLSTRLHPSTPPPLTQHRQHQHLQATTPNLLPLPPSRSRGRLHILFRHLLHHVVPALLAGP